MVEIRNDCVGCEHCVHCGQDHSLYMVCDECGSEVDGLWEYEGEQLCEECLLEAVPKVEAEAPEEGEVD